MRSGGTLTHRTLVIGVAVALACTSGCRAPKVTAQRAAEVYATSVGRATAEQRLAPGLTVVGQQILDDSANQLGTVVLITFGDRTLFGSQQRVNAALSALAIGAGRARRELDEAGIQFVELQAGHGGTRAIVPVRRLLLFGRSGESLDDLRATMQLIGNCCPHKGPPSPASS